MHTTQQRFVVCNVSFRYTTNFRQISDQVSLLNDAQMDALSANSKNVDMQITPQHFGKIQFEALSPDK